MQAQKQTDAGTDTDASTEDLNTIDRRSKSQKVW